MVASADEPLPPGAEWVESQWRLARVKEAACQGPVLLVLDEIQKVAGWSEVVKRLWNEEKARKGRIRVVLLGSSALQLHQGMTESLAGRQLWALEAKSGRGGKTPGLPAFRKRFPEAKALLIGGGGVSLEDFFKNPPEVWFDSP